MFCETITYEDYNGEERKEKFYFHFSKAEAIRLENSVEGGLSKKLQAIIDSKDSPQLVKFFEELVLGAYGIKTDDGKQFKKSEEIKNSFKESPAYDEFLMKLLTEEGYAEKFITGIAPKQN
jgi:hypothetical protein